MQGNLHENKKIKNASPLEYDGIQFRSKLEVTCYKVLKENHIEPLYEKETFTLWNGFYPTVPFYTKNTFKKGNCNLKLLSTKTALDRRKVDSWNYTPDFSFTFNNFIIFIEVKGFSNGIYEYKRKLFRKILEDKQIEDNEHSYELWEIHTKGQLLECIKHLKENEQ